MKNSSKITLDVLSFIGLAVFVLWSVFGVGFNESSLSEQLSTLLLAVLSMSSMILIFALNGKRKHAVGLTAFFAIAGLLVSLGITYVGTRRIPLDALIAEYWMLVFGIIFLVLSSKFWNGLVKLTKRLVYLHFLGGTIIFFYIFFIGISKGLIGSTLAFSVIIIPLFIFILIPFYLINKVKNN